MTSKHLVGQRSEGDILLRSDSSKSENEVLFSKQKDEDEKRTSDLFSLLRKLLRFTHVLVAHLCHAGLTKVAILGRVESVDTWLLARVA